MKKVIGLLLGIFWLSTVNAESLSADAIVEKANLAAYYAGADGRSAARMRIVDAQGRSQMRQFVILRRDVKEGGDQNYLVVFSRPADVRDTAYLVNKHPGADDDRWLYLPGLDLVKRISAGDKRTSFVGSHFYYEDISGRSPEQDNHTLLKETDEFFLLEHRPKDPTSVEFSYYQTRIAKAHFLPIQIDYFDETGKPLRSVEVGKIEIIKGYATVMESNLTDHVSGGYTQIQFRYMDYDLNMPETIFSERSLRNPPAEWLSVR
jgi:hypothetical protein